MATNMKHAQETIFGAEGLGASNFKMFPGSNRDASAEDIAQQVALSIEEVTQRIQSGDIPEMALD